MSKPLFVFPKWSNKLAAGILIALVILPVYIGALLAYGANPTTLHVGYMPNQPVPYSHKLHVGQLGMDCRYCHNTVEKAGFAPLPPTETCMNCHRAIWPNSPRLVAVMDSFATGKPVAWQKVHILPDYVYFNHSAHVNVGVSCVECHGRIDQMDQVYQVKPLNMAWCLECHRSPEGFLRPKDKVTDLGWTPPGGQTQLEYARQMKLKDRYHVSASTDCVTCHR